MKRHSPVQEASSAINIDPRSPRHQTKSISLLYRSTELTGSGWDGLLRSEAKLNVSPVFWDRDSSVGTMKKSHTSSEVQLTSYSVCTGFSFPGFKAVEALNWPLTSIYYWGWEWMELIFPTILPRSVNRENCNKVNNLQDATTFSFINLFKSAQHIPGDKFAHPQEHFLTVYARTTSGTMHCLCCRSVPRCQPWHRSAAEAVHCTRSCMSIYS